MDSLWIEPIYFDPTNTLERSEQASLIGQIHGGAESVMVWLGAGVNSAAAFAIYHGSPMPEGEFCKQGAHRWLSTACKAVAPQKVETQAPTRSYSAGQPFVLDIPI